MRVSGQPGGGEHGGAGLVGEQVTPGLWAGPIQPERRVGHADVGQLDPVSDGKPGTQFAELRDSFLADEDVSGNMSVLTPPPWARNPYPANRYVALTIP